MIVRHGEARELDAAYLGASQDSVRSLPSINRRFCLDCNHDTRCIGLLAPRGGKIQGAT